jgi:hypothetical protein
LQAMYLIVNSSLQSSTLHHDYFCPSLT